MIFGTRRSPRLDASQEESADECYARSVKLAARAAHRRPISETALLFHERRTARTTALIALPFLPIFAIAGLAGARLIATVASAIVVVILALATFFRMRGFAYRRFDASYFSHFPESDRRRFLCASRFARWTAVACARAITAC
jgi:hypothetical protein